MVYETNLLDPMWWVNNLLGSTVLLVILVELWLLSYIRKIPNMRTFSFLIFSLNIVMVIFSIFAGEGLNIGAGALVLLLAIFGYYAFKGFEDS